MKILSSSSLLEIPGQLSLRSRKRKRSAIDALLRTLVWLGRWNLVKMLESGAVSQKMSVVP
jgi:hypothetical protein